LATARRPSRGDGGDGRSHVHRFDYPAFRDPKAPLIPVEVWGKKRWNKVFVYVDSGASYSVFHVYEARRLGVRLSECDKFFIVAAGDRKIPVYTTRLTMRIDGVRLRVRVGFSRGLGGAFNLLGREDVFKRFRVCLDDRRETVTFTENEGKRRTR
jgi:hypothetical protein